MTTFNIGNQVTLVNPLAGEYVGKTTKIVSIHNEWYQLEIDEDNEWEAKDIEFVDYKVGDWVKMIVEQEETRVVHVGKNGGITSYVLSSDPETAFYNDELSPLDTSTCMGNSMRDNLTLETDDWEEAKTIYLKIEDCDDHCAIFLVNEDEKDRFVQTLKNMIHEIESLK